MINIGTNKRKCCGCKACENVCPAKCIKTELDNEGFYYPTVSSSECIDCGKCEKVCPMINMPRIEKIDQEVYAAWSYDEQTRYRASSGGMFETFAKVFFENKGVVFGAAFDNNLQLKHRYATNIEELKPLCKSKYLQSDMDECYKSVKEFLEKNKDVLFVGTPCQVAAIHNCFVGKYNNLTLVDLICHGVPSQDLFNKCMDYEEKKRNIKIKKYVFRTKIKDGATQKYYTEGYQQNNKYKEKIGIYQKSPFYYGFYKRMTLRPSCYECRFSTPERVSDITIADFHGIEKYMNNVDRMQGVSMVIVNTLKGKVLFDTVKGFLETHQFDLQTAIENNECLSRPAQSPNSREHFFNDLVTKDFSFVVNNHLTSKKSWVYSLYYSLPKQIREVARRIVLRCNI